MWLSTICLTFALVCIIRSDSAAVANSTTVETSKEPPNLSNDCTNSLKLEHINHALSRIDTSVQSLEEKAHNWAIFRHHIDAWNEQIKALEHKLDLVRRTQDEQQVYGNKFISLEFTLNHILSKVVYLSDTCNAHQSGGDTMRSPILYNTRANSNGNDNGRETAQQQRNRDTNELLYEHIALLGDVKHAIGVDKQLREELSTRLNNILRHVQNIERDNCRTEQRHTPANGNNKVAKLMAPIGGYNSNHNMEKTLKAMDQQLSKLLKRPTTPKELHQIHTLAKKDAQQMEKVVNWMDKIDEQLLQWRDESAMGWQQCQTMSGELTTFTESSDLLLKRIEFLLHEVNEKLAKQPLLKTSDRDDEEHEGEHEEPEDADMVYTPQINEVVSNDNNDVEHETNADAEAEETEDESTNDDENVDEPTDVAIEEQTDRRANVDENVDEPTDAAVEEQTDRIDDRFDIVDFLQPNKIGCHELSGPSVDGVYKFSTPEFNEAKRDFNERYCAFATDGAAWTVIQNRGPYIEHENFNRSWEEYKYGFGKLDKEFWYGNEFIHQLVDRDDYELRIELTDFENEHMWAEYSLFRLDSERYNYNLLVGGHSGTAPDAMHYHNEMDFSTYDRRNDKSVDACCACATGYGSGWWFDNCSEANLNGIYRQTPNGHNYVGIIWEQWRGDYSLFKTRMLIRPKNLPKLVETVEERNAHNEDP